MSDDELEVDETSRDLAKNINDKISEAIYEMSRSGFFMKRISISWHSNNTFSIDYDLYDGNPDISSIDPSALIVGKEEIH